MRSREAALLRMAGVPRVAAEGLAHRDAQQTTTTLPDLRRWVDNLPLDAFDEPVADREAPSGSDARTAGPRSPARTPTPERDDIRGW